MTKTSDRKSKIESKYIAHPVSSAPPPMARIIKRVDRTTPEQKSARERALAGTYRVIHGSIELPRDRLLWTNTDGTVNDYEPKTERAIMGDHVILGDEDAARMLDASIIEPLDAKPSKVGKVWEPPKTVRNMNSI